MVYSGRTWTFFLFTTLTLAPNSTYPHRLWLQSLPIWLTNFEFISSERMRMTPCCRSTYSYCQGLQLAEEVPDYWIKKSQSRLNTALELRAALQWTEKKSRSLAALRQVNAKFISLCPRQCTDTKLTCCRPVATSTTHPLSASLDTVHLYVHLPWTWTPHLNLNTSPVSGQSPRAPHTPFSISLDTVSFPPVM